MVRALENSVVHTELINRMATLGRNYLRSKLLVMLSVSATVVAIPFTNCSGFKLDNLTDVSFDSNDARAVPRMAIQNPVVVTVHGCNVPTWNQIPDHPVTTAYDPSVTFDGTQDWIAFECSGTGFVGSVAPFMMPFTLTGDVGTLSLAKGYAAVLGKATDHNSQYLFSASVPKLLFDDQSRMYLYWSAVQINK